jgi:arylformamidase
MLNWRGVSLPISVGMAVYKNLADKRPVVENTRNFAEHGMYESTLHLPLHTGTHVDYPLHAIPAGKCSSDYHCFPAEFSAWVVDLSQSPPDAIGLAQVQDLPLQGVEAVFFKTRRTPLAVFDPLFPWLTGEAAVWLAEHPLTFVGTDQPGIEQNQPAHQTHITLLSRDILIIEGLDLSHIAGGKHRFRAFTLAIRGVEAEPVLLYAAPG